MSQDMHWSADLALQLVAASICGVLAALDEVWGRPGLLFRLKVFGMWFVIPLGVVAGRSYVEDQFTVDPWTWFAGMMAILLAVTAARPAVLMMQLWPEEAKKDARLVLRSERSALTFGLILALSLIGYIVIQFV